MSCLPRALFIAGITTLLVGSAGADWNTGVGGCAARNAYVSCQGPTAPERIWEGSRPGIVSQQGVCDGDLVVVNRIESFNIPTGTWIVGHELDSGDERWAVQLPYDFPGTSWRSRVSALRDGQVYATRSGNTNLDYLYALDPADGSILWRSEGLIGEGTTESLSFAANGDLIAGNFHSLMRINHLDGTTEWEVSRSCPTSDGASAAVFGNRAYVWEASPYGPIVTAFDLDNGERLFSSEAISGGIIQQLGLMCGPDGTVYAPRTANNPETDFFVALTDAGTEFIERWRVPMGYTPFASFGVGPDGSVYTYTPDLEVLRLDPETGAELSRSMPIPYDYPAEPRVAIDAAGRVFLTNGGFGSGAVFAFTAELDLIWSEPLYGVNLGGPVLADDGTMIVCGTGLDVRAYRTAGAGVVAARPGTGPAFLLPNTPNPFGISTRIRFRLDNASSIDLQILDAQGRLVRRLLEGREWQAGHHRIIWDGRDDHGAQAPAGVYLASLRAGSQSAVRKMILGR